MSYAKQMLDADPGIVNVDAAVLAAAIDALSDCAQACTADVDDDLGEQDVTEMVKCIRLCLDCADVCTAATGVTSRQAEWGMPLSTGRCWRCAWPAARAAAMSVSGMPRCMSTAGSAPRPAGAASRPAGHSWTP